MKKSPAYNPEKIEKKWQRTWEEKKLYKVADPKSGKDTSYVLDMFPYPSGEGLHVGHPKGYIATDVYSRYQTMRGKTVLHPMGWDAFGLPAENYAIKNKVHPAAAVTKNIKRFKEQLTKLGFTYDWSRELSTTDPEYYRWTQWIFLQMFNEGLAYESYAPINWCPSCKTGLANEDLEDGKCERCGSVVEKKPLRQWVLKITDYADRLLADLKDLDWPAHIKKSQAEWIGRSEGAEIEFQIADQPYSVTVFTTRPDTLFGATYLVLSPEHALLRSLKESVSNWSEVEEYVRLAATRTEIERTAEGKEKTGVELKGLTAVNPATEERIPVWVADYVLAGYGTGAIMAVPAHDERDAQFAKKYALPVRVVVEPVTGEPLPNAEKRQSIVAFVRNPKDGKVLSINWGSENGGSLLIGGGLEKGEDPVQCAMREVAEETGYMNLHLVGASEMVHHNYRAHSKNVNREIDVLGFHFDLINEDKIGTKLEENEKNKFTVEWADPKKLAEKISDPLHQLMLRKFAFGELYTGKGVLANSGTFSGRSSLEAKKEIAERYGKVKVQYKLRDWVFARQRYWGEPFPLIFCESCKHAIETKKYKKGEFSKGELLNPGWVGVPERQLPVELPKVKSYEPSGTGESPLANIKKFVETKCPHCKGPAKRETNTMPQWAGSCWYYLRFIDPKNKKAFIDPKKEKTWMPVDLYVGGAEHATRHLIYARFWHKFLYDKKFVSGKEPFTKLANLGLILGEDGRKMSKRWGNVVNPDDVVKTYGADTLRLYEMFMGPFENSIAWSTDSMIGVRRFIERVWRLKEKVNGGKKVALSAEAQQLFDATVKKVGEDVEEFRFNTAISQMMILLNALEKEATVPLVRYQEFLSLLAPFAPHVTEELWVALGGKGTVHRTSWPRYNAKTLAAKAVEIPVQVNGKTRSILKLSGTPSEEEVVAAARVDEGVSKWLQGKEPKRIVYVPGRLLNLVVEI